MVGLIFVAIGVAEFIFTSIVERGTVEVGSFLIVFAAFGGLELDGLTARYWAFSALSCSS